jgi:DNA-binding Xre family transcriptional regulator
MKHQIIHHPSGESLVVMTLKDYEALREQAEEAEDWQDLAIYHERMREFETGQDQVMPEGVMNHFFAGNSLLKSIRMWRGKTQAEVAEVAGIGQGYLSELESKEKKGADETLARIAAALDVPPDWLV